MVIVDSTVWVDYLQGAQNPETEWLNTELERQRLGLTDIIMCEVLQGVRDELTANEVEKELAKFEVFETGESPWLERRPTTIAPFAAAVTRYERPSTP